MTALESLKKSLLGDKANETIKSGTLVTTRGTGIIAVGLIGTFLVMDWLNAAPWEGLLPDQKLTFILATGAIWAVIAAADSIARGLAARSSLSAIVELPAGLVATRTPGRDSPGWSVLAIEVTPNGIKEAVEFLVVKGSETAWVASKDLEFHNG